MKSRAVRVLVVDGDPKTGKVLQNALKKEGYRADLTPSLKAGIRKVEGGRFHIVVLDLKLAGAEGLGVLSKFRNPRQDLSMVVLVPDAGEFYHVGEEIMVQVVSIDRERQPPEVRVQVVTPEMEY